jgi:hypothetical protein
MLGAHCPDADLHAGAAGGQANIHTDPAAAADIDADAFAAAHAYADAIALTLGATDRDVDNGDAAAYDHQVAGLNVVDDAELL